MPKIRPVVHVVVRHEDKVLVYPVFHPSDENEPPYRCIGGGLDFGEYAHDAAIREFKEETGLDIFNVGLLGVIENIYTPKTKKKHQIVFFVEADISDLTAYDKETVDVCEGDLTRQAKWVPVSDIIEGKIKFVPDQAKEFL